MTFGASDGSKAKPRFSKGGEYERDERAVLAPHGSEDVGSILRRPALRLVVSPSRPVRRAGSLAWQSSRLLIG